MNARPHHFVADSFPAFAAIQRRDRRRYLIARATRWAFWACLFVWSVYGGLIIGQMP